jgi:hypothetical protein
MKPNTKFNLDINDVEQIEHALHQYITTLDNPSDKKEIVNLLAKLYHQKHWYRPKDNYVSG